LNKHGWRWRDATLGHDLHTCCQTWFADRSLEVLHIVIDITSGMSPLFV